MRCVKCGREMADWVREEDCVACFTRACFARQRHRRRRMAALWLTGLLAAYLLVAATRYRFMNPGYTETELFLRLWEAVTWS